jgi:hypothetical protein
MVAEDCDIVFRFGMSPRVGLGCHPKGLWLGGIRDGRMCRFGKFFVFGIRVRLGKEYGELWNNMGKGGHGKGDWG